MISNPGTICHDDYFQKSCFHAACVYEGPDRVDEKLREWPPQKLARSALLFYNVPDKETLVRRLEDAVPRSETKPRAGYLFVTDGTGANPWDHLPVYWDALVEELKVRSVRPK